MSTLNGKTIVIDGVEYRLVAVKSEDNRNKAILSIETPFGYVQQVVDRKDLREGVEEGDIEINGKHFVVEFCTEDEVKGEVGKSLDEFNIVDAMMMYYLADVMSNDEDKDED